MPELSRWCAQHRVECQERGDAVLCPTGHTLQEGEWTQGPASPATVEARRRAGLMELVAMAADQALRVAERDVDRAVAHLLARARRSPEVAAALLEVAARWAIEQAIGVARLPAQVAAGMVPHHMARPEGHVRALPPSSSDRGAHHRGQAQPTGGPGAVRGLQLLANANLQHLMRWRLPQGGYLGEAKHAELLEAANQLGTFARGAAVRGRWLRLVAASMPIRERVRSCFSERELGLLYGQAEREMAQLGDRVQAQLEARTTGQIPAEATTTKASA